MAGKGRDTAHERQQDRLGDAHRIFFDYQFPGARGSKVKATIMTAVDDESGRCCSTVCHRRGKTDFNGLSMMETFLKELGH